MKIAFDAQLLMEEEKTGIGWCADNILKELVKTNSNEYVLNFFSFRFTPLQLENIKKYSEQGFRINQCKWFHHVIYRLSQIIIPVPYAFFFGKADITMFFNYIVPPGVSGKKITIVHDMTYKAYPETVRERTRRILELSLEKSCKRADRILTVSEFSKSEIIKYLGIKSEKITVMPNGVDLNLYHTNYSMEDIKRVTDKLEIHGEYLLYLGTLEPRKNIERLIKAYGLLKNENKDVPKLVLAGRKGWLYESIFETVQALNLTNDIIFTGYVEAKDAPVLIKGAKMFLFPSLYEGFGMPPLEAMACGTPVVVSNNSSLPEVVGDAGIYVDPFKIESIKMGMESLIWDEEKRNLLVKKGLERVKNFTWENSVKILQEVFKELA